MVLFTHLKIISLQCFQFSIFSNKRYSNKPLHHFLKKIRVKVRYSNILHHYIRFLKHSIALTNKYKQYYHF